MRHTLSRRARFVAAAAVPLVFAAALPVTDGMTYEFVMKSTGKSTGNKEQVTLRGRGTYAGDDAKLEIIDASSSSGGQEAFGGKGTYFIVRNAGEEMLLVSPKDKTYMKWDIATMFAGMSKVMNAVGGLVKMQMTDVNISTQDLGAGETIQGYPTRHYRMIQNYTMTASMFGKKSVTKNESTVDYYFAPNLKIANPFVMNSQQMSMLSQLDMFNNPDYKNQMTTAMAKLPKNGVPLKTVTTTVGTDDKGKQETMTSVMELTNLKAGNIPASEFAIPSDYQKLEMANMAAAQGEGAAPADSAGGKKDNKADAAKKKLKSIFKH